MQRSTEAQIHDTKLIRFPENLVNRRRYTIHKKDLPKIKSLYKGREKDLSRLIKRNIRHHERQVVALPIGLRIIMGNNVRAVQSHGHVQSSDTGRVVVIKTSRRGGCISETIFTLFSDTKGCIGRSVPSSLLLATVQMDRETRLIGQHSGQPHVHPQRIVSGQLVFENDAIVLSPLCDNCGAGRGCLLRCRCGKPPSSRRRKIGMQPRVHLFGHQSGHLGDGDRARGFHPMKRKIEKTCRFAPPTRRGTGPDTAVELTQMRAGRVEKQQKKNNDSPPLPKTNAKIIASPAKLFNSSLLSHSIAHLKAKKRRIHFGTLFLAFLAACRLLLLLLLLLRRLF